MAVRPHFSDDFAERARLTGVSPNNASDVFTRPDGVAHFGYDPTGVNEYISVYLKRVGRSRIDDPFSTMVIVNVSSAQAEVAAGFRVYHEDCSSAAEQSPDPLAVLKQFVSLLGVPLRIGGPHGPVRTLFEMERIAANNADWFPIPVGRPDRYPVDITALAREVAPGEALVAIAFAIDLPQYSATLERHGYQR